MTEKDINWNWMNLDRTLSIKGKFEDSGMLLTLLTNWLTGLVIIEDSGNKSMPHYHVSERDTISCNVRINNVALITERNHSKTVFCEKTIRLFLLLKIGFNLTHAKWLPVLWKPLSSLQLQ